MKYICFAAVMISLTGCVNSSGVPPGPDTYYICSCCTCKGTAGAKKAALTEANQYCKIGNQYEEHGSLYV
jgi:hypothetical protein